MNVHKVFETIRSDVEALRSRGRRTIRIADFERYMDRLQSQVSAEAAASGELTSAQTEHYRAQRASDLAFYQAEIERSLEMGRAAIVAGQSALKSALLINGGAAIAILAFLGNLWEKDVGSAVGSTLACGLLAFGGGVLAASVGAGSTYLSQLLYYTIDDKARYGAFFQVCAVLLVIASYGLFGFGIYVSYDAVMAHFDAVTDLPGGGN